MKKLTKRKLNWKKILLGISLCVLGIVGVVVVGIFLWMQTWKTYTREKNFSIKYPPSWNAIEDVQAMGADPQEHPVAIYPKGRAVNIYIWKMSRNLLIVGNAEKYESKVAASQKSPLFYSLAHFVPLWWTRYFDPQNGSIHQDYSLDGKNEVMYNFDSTIETSILNPQDSLHILVSKKAQLFNEVVSFLIVHSFQQLK